MPEHASRAGMNADQRWPTVINVAKTMQFLPPMTENSKHTTYKKCDDWGMVYDGFTQ